MAKLIPENILITHIENPHRFWFVKPGTKHDSFSIFESDLQEFVEEQRISNVCSEEPLLLVKDTIVAAFDPNGKKWIRVRIESIDKENHVKAFAIDHGFSMQFATTNLIKLNDVLCKPSFDRVFLGGLYDVLPISGNSQWPMEATKKMIDTCAKPSKCIFIMRWKKEKHTFGDLFICPSAQEILNMRDLCIESGMAKRAENFPEELLNFLQPNERPVETTDSTKNTSKTGPQQLDGSARMSKKVYNHRNRISSSGTSTESDSEKVNDVSRNLENLNNFNRLLPVRGVNLELLEPNSIHSPTKLSLLLTHSVLKVHPIADRNSSFFGENVYSAMREYTELYASQSYAWPHLMRNNSLVIVDSPSKGKTLAYVPAICSLIQTSFEEDFRLREAVDPAVIVISPNVQSMTKIAAMFRKFMRFCKYPHGVVEAGVTKQVEKVIIEIFNDCNILICTPKMLVDILKKTDFLLRDSKVIKHVIFDNVNLILKDFKGEYDKIRTWHKQKLKSAQTVATSRQWDPSLMSLVKSCQNPLLIIGNFVEAYFYARATFDIEFCEESQKIQRVLEYLKSGHYSSEKTMIVCDSDKEVDEISAELTKQNIANVGYNNQSTIKLGYAVQWSTTNSGRHSVLICSDTVIRDLLVRSAQIIIHFSLSERYESFAYRFSASLDCIHNSIADNSAPTKKLKSIILLDEFNNKQLPKIIDIIERYDSKQIPEKVKKLSEKLRNKSTSDHVLPYVPLCSTFIVSGQRKCHHKCGLRHALTMFDARPANFPAQGWVKVRLLQVNSPIHYTVRLLEHYQGDDKKSWQPIQKSTEYAAFSMKFTMQCQQKADLQPIESNIKDGDFCVIFDGDKPCRGQIVKRDEQRKHQLFGDIEFIIKLIDNQRKCNKKASEIYQIPTNFIDFPAQAVDVHLVHMQPKEITWTKASFEAVNNALNIPSDSKTTQQIQVHVIMSLKNTLIVDYVRVMENVSEKDAPVETRSVRRILKQYGTVNRNMFLNFEKIVTDNGLDQPIDQTESIASN